MHGFMLTIIIIVAGTEGDQHARNSPTQQPADNSKLRQSPCNCRSRCATKRCPCKLDSLLCGIYCHPSRKCANKLTIGAEANGDIIDLDRIPDEDEQNIWVTIGKTDLTAADKAIVTSDEWLIMFAAQQLLQQQHPSVSGLQDPSLHQDICCAGK